MPNYFQLIEQGPFPNQIDPWAEQGRYFHQLHAQMIGLIVAQIQKPLFKLGYVAGREASLQIAENSIPDLFIERTKQQKPKTEKYSDIAATMELELGAVFSEDKEPELDALYIKSLETGQLVTIIEIVSPNNKTKSEEIARYQARRKNLLWQNVHIVELDFTRSIKRLITSGLVSEFPYHIAIHLYDEDARFIGISLKDSPKKFGLPLRGELIPLDLNPIYRQAYRELMIASQIEKDWQYAEEKLPFPSLLSDDEHKYLLRSVQEWQEALKIAER